MKKTILIVEDNDELRNFLKKILISNNFKVIEASDGAMALEAVEKYLPDLVLLDFGLPKVSGETVCVKIKKEHPDIIVIALTDKIKSSDVVHGLQIGADDYIGKPFVTEELIARIDTRFKAVVNGQVDIKKKQAGQTSVGKEEPEVKTLILKESFALIILKIIFTEVIFGFLLLIISILFSYLGPYLNNTYPSGLYLTALAGSFLVNIVIIILVVLRWNSAFAKISEEGVTKHSGILNRKQQKYACNFVEGSKVEQSLLGLLFNYGTIELYDPALKEQVYLLNITDPKKFSRIIQKILLKEDSKSMPFLAK